MPSVRIAYRMVDGDVLHTEIETDDSYPDALSDLTGRIQAMFRDALCDLFAVHAEAVRLSKEAE